MFDQIKKFARRSWRWVLNHVFHRAYHLKLDKLSSDWYDKDEVIIHAVFQCLVDFVEDEDPGGTIEWNSDDEHRHAWAEITRLYRWWTIERIERDQKIDEFNPMEQKLRDAGVMGCYRYSQAFQRHALYPEWRQSVRDRSKMEMDAINEDTENMIALIRIRHWLWT